MEPATTSSDIWHGTLTAHRARTSEGIIGAAMDIVSSDGIAGLSMSALAEAAGVSRQTLYKYFADVDAVLAEMAAMGSVGISELAGRIEAEPDPREGVRVFVAAILESAAAGHPSPLALAAAVPASSREAMHAHEQAAESLVVGLLARGGASGVFRVDVDPELDGRLLYRAAFAAHDLVLEPGADVASLVARITDDLLRMVESGPDDALTSR